MKSSHCQMTVTQVVKSLGADVTSVAPAHIEINLSEGTTKESIISAIQKAGYKVL